MLSIFGWGASAQVGENLPEKMKRWTTLQDGIDKMKLEEGAKVPEVRDGEVLIRVKAVGLNYRDVEVCKGTLSRGVKKAPSPPVQPASDLCGTIIASKSSNKSLKVGMRVTALPFLRHQSGPVTKDVLDSGLGFPLDGVLAEYVSLPGEAVVPVPEYLSDAEVCCLPTSALRAYIGLDNLIISNKTKGAASTQENAPTILIQGTTATSLSALQLAKLSNLKTIVTSTSDSNLEKAEKDLKADSTINTLTHWDLSSAVMDFTSSLGATTIFSPNGAKTLRKSLSCVAAGGTVNLLGYTSGKGEEEEQKGGGGTDPEGSIGVSVLAQRQGVVMRGLIAGGRDKLEEVMGVMEKGKVKPVVEREYGFEEVKKALGRLEDGEEVFGKVVVRVSG